MFAQITIFKKGVILLCIPLLFQFALLGLVSLLQRRNAEAAHSARRAQEIQKHAELILRSMLEAETQTRNQLLTGLPGGDQPHLLTSAELQSALNRLENLVQEQPEQQLQVRTLARNAHALLDWHQEIRKLVLAGKRDQATVRITEGKAQMDAIRRDILKFVDQADQRTALQLESFESAQADILNWLVGGFIASLLLTLGLALLFHRGVAHRLLTLTQNTHRLQEGKTLAAPLQGDDEIAQADRAFHEAARVLARTLDEVRDLYNNAPCGYHSLDPAGTILTMNDTELKWLGYTSQEVLGKKRLADLMTPASQQAFEANFIALKEQGAVNNLEYEMVRKDGTIFPVMVNSTVICDASGNFLASRSTLFDLTARKRAEATIRKLNAELEVRVKERTEALAEANRELVQKNQENEMFVYSVSHDLRSPLVNLQGFSQELARALSELSTLLADPSLPQLPAPVQKRKSMLIERDMGESIRFIQTAVTRLGSIIDALLRLSRAGRIVYQWQNVDVGALVERVVDSLRSTTAQRSATVVMKKDLPSAWGDPTALEQVFANLIDNALNYLDPKRPGIIEVGWIAASADTSLNGHRLFYVKDNGLGIADAHKPKLFQAFQRLHAGNPAVNSPGEGIGLTIVQRVVQRHHGRIWVESKVGVGSTFFVALPISEQSMTEPSSPSAELVPPLSTAPRPSKGTMP